MFPHQRPTQRVPTEPYVRGSYEGHEQPDPNPKTREELLEIARMQRATGNYRQPDLESDPSDNSESNDDNSSQIYRERRLMQLVVQHFFTKAALIIASSRVQLVQDSFEAGGVPKKDKWYGTFVDESKVLLREARIWKDWDLANGAPPVMHVEIYLDLSELNKNQSLVSIDEQGRRWNVEEALNPDEADAVSSSSGRARMHRTTQVVLERWEFEMDKNIDASDVPSVVYKKGLPLFRSLYTFARQLPAYKFSRRIARQALSSPALQLKYRIINTTRHPPSQTTDALNIPLSTTREPFLERYEFEPLQSPSGVLTIGVQFRSSCDFRVDDAESLLSSHFLANPLEYYAPNDTHHQVPHSVPSGRNRPWSDSDGGPSDQGQVYGSMSTFHRPGNALGTSPVSAIRAMQDEDSSSSTTPPPHRKPPNHRNVTEPKSSLRSEPAPAYPRRPSVSFQPFKAGSLASSPASGLQVPPSPSSSVPGRPVPFSATGFNPLAQARSNRNSLTTLPQQALRAPSLPNETAIASSASSSPKPAPINRYSSSFSHRKSRFSVDGGSKGDNDQGSSGKPSPSSSAQRGGSDLINEGQGVGGSSDSIPQTDDDNLKNFIAMLEQKKELKSFNNSDSKSRDATMRRTTAALNKYQRMRESNAQLSDSMSSSALFNRSSSSSSRQLTSLPPMIHGTSASTSSSPGKPISPHTPHTPAVPSRLSANSIANYSEPRRSRSRGGRRDIEATREEASSDTTTRDTGTTAIDIPTSPRSWAYARRSSSVTQQQRALDDEPDLYGRRSNSLPADERTDLSMSELLRVTEGHLAPPEEDRSPEPDSTTLQAYPFPASGSDSREETSRPSSVAAPANHLRGLLSRGRRGSPSFTSDRGSRYSGGGSRSSVAPEEDELIFHLSELGSASRRSLEEGRGGGASGSSAERRRGGF
ncbi:hypothetical protein EJ08DRAFT_495046 [Tothia fuscella]|uniref:Autophagy-related protein 13 n=1 Tax=Tothia fuscella TaxID=1048955 RepID=A0A9P4NYN3_9PEZI|nr:hypothetical protein EJ08DRAFT_495046 [Tothia fuscella]